MIRICTATSLVRAGGPQEDDDGSARCADEDLMRIGLGSVARELGLELELDVLVVVVADVVEDFDDLASGEPVAAANGTASRSGSTCRSTRRIGRRGARRSDGLTLLSTISSPLLASTKTSWSMRWEVWLDRTDQR
jgi:hypothetical protein